MIQQPMIPLLDTFNRRHNNLRISVTDRCNLRCVYCMPEEVTFRERSELLTFEEIAAFVRIAATLGIDKVRLTGGEPLLRKDMPALVERLACIPGIRDLGMTTNGLLLAAHAEPLRRAGLSRLNISLDTLDETRFRTIARRPGATAVVAGIEAALAAGFKDIKLNAVILRGINDLDIVPLAEFARRKQLEMRYIEYMPIGAEAWERRQVVTGAEILRELTTAIGPLVPFPDDPSAPAERYAYADGSGTVGFISSVSRPFCRSCNRLRLTAEGKLRNCLFSLNEADVRPLLRADVVDEAALVSLIRNSVRTKWEGHEINSAQFLKPERTMHSIGG